MERDAAVITPKRTGIFIPQRKRSCTQVISSCERGYTYRLGVNYSTFVPLLVYQIYLCTNSTTCGLPTQIRRARLNSIRLMIISNDHVSNKTNYLREQFNLKDCGSQLLEESVLEFNMRNRARKRTEHQNNYQHRLGTDHCNFIVSG